jgi:hypothetical protein
VVCKDIALQGQTGRDARMNNKLFWIGLVGLSLLGSVGTALDETQATDLSAKLERAKQLATLRTYQLRYKFRPGEVLRWKVVHLTTVETTVQGKTQEAKTRAVSTKAWKVTDVDEDGNMTFEHSVPNVKMWQQIDDRDEVRFDSTRDKTPPPEYALAAKNVGVTLATIKLAPNGRVLDRGDSKHSLNLGLGDIAIPFPEQPVAEGHTWYVSDEVRVRLPDKRVRKVKTRVEFTLDSVHAGIARISMKTQLLTPVRNPKVRSQLIQRLTNGTVKFDIDAGRVISRQTDWDETVIGFEGPDSLMKYLARFTEELLPYEATARAPAEENR